jgi:hypothetical protein
VTRRIALALLTGLALLPAVAAAADLRGRVTLADGRPAANEPIMLGNRAVGRTDVAGVFVLSLPAGMYTLTIKGQAVPIQVLPNGNRHDVHLK